MSKSVTSKDLLLLELLFKKFSNDCSSIILLTIPDFAISPLLSNFLSELILIH